MGEFVARPCMGNVEKAKGKIMLGEPITGRIMIGGVTESLGRD